MKTLYLLLGGIINSILAQMLPYIIKISASCLYLIVYFIGYYDGSDIRGEEGVIVIILPLTLFLIALFLVILILKIEQYSEKYR